LVIIPTRESSQYSSLDFALRASHAEVQLSFGSTGHPYDNAAMATFRARLKTKIAWIRGGTHFDTIAGSC